MPVYSYGEDSPIKFEVSDKLAKYYNEAVEQFIKAQTRFTQKFGRVWDPVADPIEIKWNNKQRKAWNEIAGVMNKKIKTDGPFHINDIMDDYLVRNVASAVISAGDKWGRHIGTAAMVGAVYVVLRGL